MSWGLGEAGWFPDFPTAGDFLFIADTSVNSTKLNLILETEAVLRIGSPPRARLPT